jgi:hypothetical protein
MRHLYIIFLCSFTTFLSVDLFAQCVPDTTITGLYSPTEQEGLPEATIGLAYEAVIHMSVPAETTITISLSVDSVVLTAVNGLPSGLSYECQNSTCGTEGGDFGCIRIFGTPDNPLEVGSNDLVAVFQLHTNLPTFTYDLKDYSITLNAGTPADIAELDNLGLNLFSERNPMTKGGNLVIQSASSEHSVITIYSLLGSVLGSWKNESGKGLTRVPVDQFNLQPGVYFAVLRQGGESTTLRFVLQ